MELRYILSALVQNHAGVLSRVFGIFSRRGYNTNSFIELPKPFGILELARTGLPALKRRSLIISII